MKFMKYSMFKQYERCRIRNKCCEKLENVKNRR